jgi:hypothetical protein
MLCGNQSFSLANHTNFVRGHISAVGSQIREPATSTWNPDFLVRQLGSLACLKHPIRCRSLALVQAGCGAGWLWRTMVWPTLVVAQAGSSLRHQPDVSSILTYVHVIRHCLQGEQRPRAHDIEWYRLYTCGPAGRRHA